MKPDPTLPTRPIRMAALARLSGVPAATIKHYLREGLLPQPSQKTGRNMAFYDASLAERIKQIKTLQREHFLPLRVIKSVLEGRPSEVDDAETAAVIQRALASMESKDIRTRAQLLASGAPAEDLALLERLGIITARNAGGEDTFSGDDLTLLRLLGMSRRAGITREMLPPDIVASYIQAIGELVRMELEMFRVGVVPRAGENLAAITDAATRLSEQLVVLIRRKMLLPTLDALVKAHVADSPPEQASPARRRRMRAPAGVSRSKKNWKKKREAS